MQQLSHQHKENDNDWFHIESNEAVRTGTVVLSASGALRPAGRDQMGWQLLAPRPSCERNTWLESGLPRYIHNLLRYEFKLQFEAF